MPEIRVQDFATQRLLKSDYLKADASVAPLATETRSVFLKRVYDIMLASVGLFLFWPVLLLIAVVVRIADGGPVLFRQQRVGLLGTPFSILKFRTMVTNAEQLGSSLTAAGDCRITRVGRFLRRTKLDELPQLWNVLVGDMSFVGPRPEVPRYIACYTAEQRRVLSLKPGITDLATILYRDEEQLLGNVSNVEQTYLDAILPRKIEINLAYARQACLWEDTKIILRTLFPKIPLKSRSENIC
jgi:lipopolysaccharide/colanic/teichoic acid biosynthesis glycosyltransferase